MNTCTTIDLFTHIVVARDRDAMDLFGPSFQFLVAPQPSDDAPCVIKGTIPPGGSVPIHRHFGVEACFVLSGTVEAPRKDLRALRLLVSHSRRERFSGYCAF